MLAVTPHHENGGNQLGDCPRTDKIDPYRLQYENKDAAAAEQDIGQSMPCLIQQQIRTALIETILDVIRWHRKI
jgi:hypothetical protein